MRYILGVIGVIILTIIAVVLIVSNGPGDSRNTQEKPDTSVAAANYADDPSIVQYLVRGPLKGETEHQEVRITISRDRRTIDIIKGYEGRIDKTNSYDNSQASYESLLHALDKLGFTRTRKTSITDERGICPFGNLYSYELKSGSQSVSRTWSTSCSTGQGTAGGVNGSIRQLFQQQIPDYSTQTSGLNINI